MLNLGTELGEGTFGHSSIDYAAYLIDVSLTLLSCLNAQATKLEVREILRQSRAAYSTLLVALLYLLRLKQNIKEVNECLDGRLLLTTVILVASKYLLDGVILNTNWCAVAGTELGVLNRMEMWVLETLDYRVNVRQEVFHGWVEYLFREECVQKYLISRRISH